MTDGSEILDESKPFSIVAVIALVLSLLGIFSILFVPFIPVALAAAGLGILARVLQRNNDYNSFSTVAAILAIFIGILSVSTGGLARNFSTQADLFQAKKAAEMYLDLIHKQDFDRIALISGMDTPPEEFQSRKPTDQEKFLFVKKALQSSPVYKEIAALPETPKWRFVRLEAEDGTSYYCDYQLIYRDEARAKFPLYKLGVRRDQPKGGPLVHPEKRGRELTEEDFKVRWTVEYMEKMK